MLIPRQLKLMKMLEQDSVYLSVSDLSKKLRVSQRTVYSDLNRLKETGVSIESRRGSGVRLQTVNHSMLEVENNKHTVERRIKMMKRLLFDEELVTIAQLANHYFVSQSSIQNDLKAIDNILSNGLDVSVLLSNRKGTHVNLSDTVTAIHIMDNFNRFVLGTHRHQLAMTDTTEVIDSLIPYYSEEKVTACSNVCYAFVRRNLQTISEIYVEGFLSVLIAFVQQLSKGKHVMHKYSVLENKKHAFYISSAVNILHKLSLRLQFEYSNSDVEYLSQLLLNYRFEQVPIEELDDELILKFVGSVGRALNIDFSNDRQLFLQLKAHVPAMLYRLKCKNFARNPFTEQIKLEFSITYNVLWLVMEDISQEWNVEFNEDEVAFLTIYFQMAIERVGKNKKILVVCQTGIVTSELLIHRIKSCIPSMDEVEVASVLELMELDVNDYDIVLTTVQLTLKNDNLFYISPFAKNEEIISLLTKECKKSKDSSVGSKLLRPRYKLIQLSTEQTREESLRTICGQLLDSCWVTEDFLYGVFEREKIGNTEFPMGVALPHGHPKDIRQTFVVVARLQKKIKWQDSFVDTIIMIGISKNDMRHTRSIVASIYEVISKEEQLGKLKQVIEVEELEKVFYGSKENY